MQLLNRDVNTFEALSFNHNSNFYLPIEYVSIRDQRVTQQLYRNYE